MYYNIKLLIEDEKRILALAHDVDKIKNLDEQECGENLYWLELNLSLPFPPPRARPPTPHPPSPLFLTENYKRGRSISGTSVSEFTLLYCLNNKVISIFCLVSEWYISRYLINQLMLYNKIILFEIVTLLH